MLVGLVLSSAAGIDPAPAGAASSCPAGQAPAGPQVCLATGDPQAAQALSVVRSEYAKYSLNATLFGVWRSGKVVAEGALGTSYPLVPAARDMHFRIGNIVESMTCTLLLQLVERGKLHLSDPISKWLPSLPNGNKITVGMLAQGTSGYASFYTDQWTRDFQNDPFRAWTPAQIIGIGTSQPLDFAPGSNWAFSDTNYMILAEVLAKAGGAPLDAQLQHSILDPLGLRSTAMTSTSYIPAPVLHGYDPERGDYQDSTYWSVSWATGIGNMTSDLPDMGRWAAALGNGTVLTPAMHARQFAPVTVGFKTFTPRRYPALGGVVTNGWIVCNPNVPGYWDALGYLPKQKLAVVVISTPTATSPPNVHYAVATFDQVAARLAPSSPPDMPYAQ